MLSAGCPFSWRINFTPIANKVYTPYSRPLQVLPKLMFPLLRAWRFDCLDTGRVMNSLPERKGHMPAIEEKVDNQSCTDSMQRFHPEGAGSESTPHCPACAMVDELIQELIRKQVREATRS